MAIVNSRAAIEPKTGKAAIFVNETIHSLMRKLFSNGEQGFFYDPNDLSTMFQDAAGTVPVTAAGQAVGLILDKSKGLVLGSELLPSVASMTRWVTTGQTANGSVTSNGTSITLAANGAGILSCASASLDRNKFYLFSITVSALTGTLYLENATAGKSIAIAQPGTYTTIATNVGSFYFRNSGGVCTATVTAASAKELSGNHAYQTTSSMRPLLVANPQRLDYDTVDDKLITNLPAQLTGCTVIRSVPNVGTQILTGQTIPVTYEDNTDHCGLIVINRALTPSETSAITAEFNKRAGV